MKKYKLTFLDKHENELKSEIIEEYKYKDAMSTRDKKLANSLQNDLKKIKITKI